MEKRNNSIHSHGERPASLAAAGLLTGNRRLDTAASERPEPLAQLLATNPIVVENQKTGNPSSEWDITGAGSTNIEGYATDISVNVGNTINFKINTSSTNYRLEIYRLGYYGGMGARLITTIQRQIGSAQVQPAAERDNVTGLVDAGNWGVSASWAVPSDAVSGIYIVHLVRQDATAGENHIPFIVRDDARTSDIVFQTSDTTWQAYNTWGGISLYGGNGPGAGPVAAGRAYKVSYNRPFITRGGGFDAGPQDWIFGVEYPAIRWLERNGYDVTYLTGVDAARSGSLLLNHKIFLSVGHDEYWSGEQRANVEAARDAGVSMAFLSGNEVYWKTRWEASIAGTATNFRTLVCYKETRANGDIDPDGQWTGTYRDPRFAGPNALGAGRPENALTGTIFTVDSYRQDTLQIPFAYAGMRFWRNTSIANLTSGQVASLPAGYLGYEWDSDLDNGFRPAGLVNLSSTTVSVPSLLLDYGTTTGPGVAEHNLTLYRAASGALVFGAGTVYWAWGLDNNHDLEQVVDDVRVKQAMVNLFADMDVQPATLQAGLVAATKSTDTTAPVSTINAVANPLPFGQPVTISGTATDSGGGVVGGVEISTDGGARWHKAVGRGSWSYVWTPTVGGTYALKSRAVDDSGNLEVPGTGIVANVSGPTGLTVFSQDALPITLTENDASSVELGMKFIPSSNGTVSGVRFFKGPQNVGTHTGRLWTASGTLLGTVTFTGETASGWQTATFATPIPVSAATTYVVSYHTAGYYSANGYFFTSAMTNGPLTAPDNVSSGGNGVYAAGPAGTFPNSSFNATNYWVDVLYQQAIVGPNVPPVANNDSGFVTMQNTALQIAAAALLANDTDANGDTLVVTGVSAPSNGTVNFNGTTNVITFTPANGYTGVAGFTYTISDGRGGTASATVSLTVTAPPAGTGVLAVNGTPATITVVDTASVELGMKFTPSANGTISGIRFYKGPQNLGTHTGTLWTSAGAVLGTVTFTNETASGWQSATFASPISVTGGASYVVSYHSGGYYSASSNFFASAVTNGALTAPSSASSGGNGVYIYSASTTFPTNSFNASNYWVDVYYAQTTPPANQAPVANNDSGFTTMQNVALQIAASALLANDTDADGDTLTITGVSAPSNGTVSFNGTTNIITFTPTSGYVGSAGFTYAISDGRGGTASANAALTVTGASLFAPSATPATIWVNDTSAVELGMKFSASSNGTITGVRFYKGALNTGTHVGNLWSSSGTLLGTVTFSGETASGWQTASFASPIAVTSGTTYVISYHCSGNYSATGNGFGSAVTNGPLTAPSSAGSIGNGVYVYGASSAFPTNSFNATNYWVDVVFKV